MSQFGKNKELIRQAGAIPYRKHGGELEFCLITSVRKKRWGFPKGIIDPGDSSEETALKEAYEEAGLRGEIQGEPLGSFRYSKWQCDLTVVVLLMKVQYAARVWEESDLRDRLWAREDKARKLIHRPALKELLDLAVKRIS